MASARRLRTTSRQTSKSSEGGIEKDDDGGEKSKHKKRKLSEMLGPPWNEEDLELFYQSYRKFGKNWKKVSTMLHERTVEMVEALYGMNKAYLSLPEEATSAAGLKAMMTDHYNILEENRSDGEESSENMDTSGNSRKTDSYLQGQFEKLASGAMVDLNPVPSAYNGPSPAKRRRIRSRMAIKVPQIRAEENIQKKVKTIIAGKQKHQEYDHDSDGDCDFNKVATVVALTLAKASNSIASPQVSHTSSQKANRLSDKKDAVLRNDLGGSDSKNSDSNVADHKLELCKVHKIVENGVSIKSRTAIIANLGGAMNHNCDIRGKSTNPTSKKPNMIENFDKFKEDCKSTDEETCMQGTESDEENAGPITLKPALLLTDKLSPERIKKRSRQLFCGAIADDSSGLDTLATLADLSLNGLLPSPTLEPVKHFEEEERCNLQVSQSNLEDAIMNETRQALVKKPSGHASVEPEGVKQDSKSKVLSTNNLHELQLPPESRKKKRRTSADKLSVHGQASTADPPAQAELKAESMPIPKQRNKSKRPANSKSIILQHSKTDQAYSSNAENQESVIGGFLEDQGEIPNDGGFAIRVKSKKRTLLEENSVDNSSIGFRDRTSLLGTDYLDSRSIINEVSYCPHSTAETGPFTAKAKLIHCLSSKVRRWSTYEWFYSAIDLPWFSQNEFVEYLNHAGLGKIPKLTRVEWGVIRSSLGKPRRFSSKFLQEEREKLDAFREDARKCYYDLRSGTRISLPADLARPLTVGQRVIARHQRTRQIHDGNILTVDLNRCRVQFDRPDLGVEFVPDIDVMPVHTLENMSELMRRQRVILEMPDRLIEDSNFMNRPVFSAGGAARAALNERLERPGTMPTITAPSHNFLNTLSSRAQADTVDSVAFAKAAANEAALAVQQAVLGQTITTAQAQAREADIRALAELSRTLDKKEALLVELRNMNDEADHSMKDIEACPGSALFQRQYATVVLQLKEVNKQVSAALLQLRHRNRYQDNLLPPWHSAVDSQGLTSTAIAPSELSGLIRFDSGPSVDETIASAKKQAWAMVFTAIKAMTSLKEGEDALLKLGGALSGLSKESLLEVEYASRYNLPVSMLGAEASRNFDCEMALHSNAQTLTTDDLGCVHDAAFGDVDHRSSCTGKESTILIELMASCVATLLMIQTCTEAYSQPSRVAVLLTSALQNLRPRSPENLYIYHEIEQCIDALRSQILAQIPIESYSRK
ncbi:hypothetical protein O6H91_17G047000 [Diphasiastrum complanatum]|uniref:Uncharacterized protein n=1 Tax=Diphasiastrum complanatum TaxID=34168 RepID=A0ACC2B6F2_DIPCM|nr:hypothetical protein O6H91_17G047000 [Diphasiastrum complanatum]